MSRPPVDGLTESVTARAGRLHSAEEAAAVLETLGLTDDAAQELRRANVFHLGREVHVRQRSGDDAARAADAAELELRRAMAARQRPPPVGRRFAGTFGRGLGFVLPSVLMVAAFLGLSLTLWASRSAGLGRAAAVGAGVAASVLATGGFTQAIGRRGLWYLRQEVPLLALKSGVLFLALGAAAAAVTGAALWALLEAWPLVPEDQIRVALAYHATLSALWLCLALLYMAERELVAAVVVAAGIAVAYLARQDAGATLLVAHQAGIVTAAVLALAFAVAALVGRETTLRRVRRVRYANALPRVGVTVRAVAPYFLYGLLLFGLLFVDRLLAWTGKAALRPTLLTFQPDYEAGLVWAALAMLFGFGVLEFAAYRQADLLRAAQHRTSLVDARAVGMRARRWYRQSAVSLLVAAGAGAAVALAAGLLAAEHSELVDGLVTPRSLLVFCVAAPSYGLLLWSLLNANLAFALTRPAPIVRAAGVALALDLVVGLVASRAFGYWGAVFGLAAGAVVFWALSTSAMLRILRRADYHLYAAF